MAVAVVTQLRANPGKLQETQANAAQVVKIFERMGTSMRALMATVAGANSGTILLVAEYSDMAGFAAGFGKLQADAEWQKYQAQISASPVATILSRGLLSELSPASGQSGQAGSVLLSTGLSVIPGKQEQALKDLDEVRGIIQRLGARVRLWQSVISGAGTGTMHIVGEFSDMAAYGAYAQKLQGDSEWQRFTARVGANPAATVAGRSLLVALPPQR